MYHFVADPRDGAVGGGCSTCCCQPAQARPGETNKWIINYAPWSVPLGGPGLIDSTLFEISLREGCEPSPTEASVITPLLLATPLNTPLEGSLLTSVVNPNAEPVSFSTAIFGGASNGVVTINADGTFTYTPINGFTGYDRFWWQVEVGTGNPMVGETVIGVGDVAAPTDANGTPMVSVSKGSVKIDQRLQVMTFALAVSPAARVGCVYRLSIKQKAMDCDVCYTHLMCFDIKIVKC